jgi:hypothetical protein
LWLSQFLEALLYGLQASDLLTMSSAVAVLVLVALAAGSLPAARVARLQPSGIFREM